MHDVDHFDAEELLREKKSFEKDEGVRGIITDSKTWFSTQICDSDVMSNSFR
jgi:hypothetical protein